MPSAKEYVMPAVLMLLSAILLPIAVGYIVSTTTTSWNAAVVTMWQILLPVLAIIGIAIEFIPRGGD